LEIERISGYFITPWLWDKIKTNQQWIIQLASTDDPCIPITQARHIQKNLGTEYHEFSNKGHFLVSTNN
jgi:predicted alpha/beta hydrolase family esterase